MHPWEAVLLSLWLGAIGTACGQAGPVEVIPPELRGATQPQVAVASNQKVFVAFGKGELVYCAVSNDRAKSFLAPHEVARLPKLALGLRRGPRIVASAAAVTISAVSQQDGNLYAWTSGDGGQTWSRGATINSVPGSAREGLHGMAGDPQGNAYAVWLDGRNQGTQFWGAGSHDGGRTWSENVRIYQSPDGHICECCHPCVQVGLNGYVRVMWRNWLAGSRDMYSAMSNDGGKNFTAASKLGSGTWPLAACPMDGGGLAGYYTVWRRDTMVYYTDARGGEHVLGGGRQPVAALGKGGPYFIWEENSRLLVKKGGLAPLIFCTSGSYPSVATVSTTEAPILAWESSANGVQTIFAQSLE